MKLKHFPLLGFFIASYFTAVGQGNDYPIQPKAFNEVKVKDAFWAPKIKTNQEVTIPIAIQKSMESGRVDNFKIAGDLMDGQFCSEYPFDDSDIYKIIEAASYSLQTIPDPELEKTIDSLIYFVSVAQEDDGYIYTTRTIGKNVHEWAGDERWEKVNDLSHELYNLGHMFEAAAAHYTATGKRTLLDIAIKSADLIDEDFGPGKIEDYPGHQEVELGLVKLYRVTKDEKYLKLAKYFLDIRGKEGIGSPTTYNQSHKPVTEQEHAVGHAVRAAYMWIAMADVAALTSNEDYIEAIDRLWHDVVDTKMYVIGGIGATGNHEGFDDPYVLPNMSAYNETCAAIGNALWNHRMFLMTGDSKYIDVMERSMYNNVISGVSVSGDHFFYPNPLASYGQHSRSEWFGCACCPPNVARFLPYMPGLIYAQNENDIYVNLFVSSDATFKLGKNELSLSQKAELPWEGTAELEITAKKAMKSTLKIRIPGWAKNQPVPSDLYTYASTSDKKTKITVNGEEVPYELDEKGYIDIDRKWKNGDKVGIEFPYEIREVKANPNIADDKSKVAIERGPIVYCTEWSDYKDGHVLNLVFDPKSTLTASFDKGFYGGATIIEGDINKAKKNLDESVDVSEKDHLKLIPYYLWNNRGPGEMRVWLPTEVDATRPLPAPTKASKSIVTASVKSKAIIAINDQQYPKTSNDSSNPYLHWWPKKGTWEWVQYEFEAAQEVSEVKVYWYDDGPFGGCRIPNTWEVVYEKDGEWVPVKTDQAYKVSKDDWNTIKFEPITAKKVRLKIKLDKKFAAGLHEWIVE
ncbi:glycoside hydrolase family 127 protein [Flammeovirgaceae bacterium SG7u.111]|nr:glycoside hydrolase family 127 protein [Flammeovirgaceae bacterium SG7u.132]WPO35151.1 glycoside hydrolase family 127 protein [Flammeovirgaceae bacterium SG7u.111]